jgi:protein-S-isoprenylcysteine O-methyltransferase Ste14
VTAPADRSASRGEGAAGAPDAPWRDPMTWLLPAIAVQAMVTLLEPRWTGGLTLVQGLGAFGLTVAGAWLMREAARELDWNATPVCVDEAPRARVATGPYRLSRHPMYLGAVVLLLGVATALGSLFAAAVAIAFGAWLDLCWARPEEDRLGARFGPAWAAYAANVRRWL